MIAAATGVACSALGTKAYTGVIIGWDVFCALMISISWIIFATAKADQIPHLAWKNDENRALIFVIVLFIVLASLFGIILLVQAKDSKVADPFSMLGIFLSWFLLHTMFTNHYGHLFYGDDENNPGEHNGGLAFPGKEDPDYLDLAYFSFVVGMTFQVSDVEVTDKRLRRLVLLHGMISFIFNTIIVALTISVVADLNKS